MGFYFLNYQEFEKKRNNENRLILNFYYRGENNEKNKKIKLFAKTNITIPTDFIHGKENLEELIQKIEKDKELTRYPVETNKYGNFYVAKINIPNNKKLIDKLPSNFQKREYDKMLKLDWLYPDSKISVMKDVFEDIIKNAKTIQIKNKKGEITSEEKEIELRLLKGIFDNEFMSEKEFRELPSIYWDIEKPLWKKESEKIWIKRREKLLKKNYSTSNLISSMRQEYLINKLEKRLTIDVENVGEIRLWEKDAEAIVSSIAMIWKNCNYTGEQIKELYVFDPKSECKDKSIDDYNVFKFKTEKDLIKHFDSMMKKRKPVISTGHNEVYDVTQVKFAAEALNLDFNPAVDKIRPKRDFVRSFFQRLKQDMIYLDTLWLNRMFYPFLQQRSLDVSLKLADVLRFHGFDFKKSHTHEQLRFLELQKLYGKTSEIRKSGWDGSNKYVVNDVTNLPWIIENLPFIPLITKLKEIIPCSTYTELAFHTNVAQKYLDKKHFDRCSNKRFSQRQQKMRQNEIQIFKKRFASLKKSMLDYSGVSTKKEKGIYENVLELYLPLEEWIKNASVSCPEWLKLSEKITEREKIPFLNYFKTLQRDDMLKDYYFARRESKIFREYKIKDLEEKFAKIGSLEQEKLNSFLGSFNHLKDHFRSIYVALEGTGGWKLLLPNKKNLEAIEYSEIMKQDADLFLLKQNAEEIEKKLSKNKKSELTRFLSNFETFEKLKSEIAKEINESEDTIYLYNQFRRKSQREEQFQQRHKISVPVLTEFIANSYKNLTAELKKYNAKIIDHKGDYLFVQADEGIKNSKLVYLVREFKNYSIK